MVAREPNWFETTIAILPCTNARMLNQLGSNVTTTMVPSTNGPMWTKMVRYDHCNSLMYIRSYVEPCLFKYDHCRGPIYQWSHVNQIGMIRPLQFSHVLMVVCWTKLVQIWPLQGPIYQWSHVNQIGPIRPLQFSHVPMVVCWTKLVQIWPLEGPIYHGRICEPKCPDMTIAIFPCTNGRMLNQIGSNMTITRSHVPMVACEPNASDTTIAILPCTNGRMLNQIGSNMTITRSHLPMVACVNQNRLIWPLQFSHIPMVVCWTKLVQIWPLQWSHLPMVACVIQIGLIWPLQFFHVPMVMLNQVGSNMPIPIVLSTNGRMWTKLVQYDNCNSPIYQCS